MSVLRNRKCIANWNEWKDKNRIDEIKKEMKKIGRDWVREKEIIPVYDKVKKENMKFNREFSEEE